MELESQRFVLREFVDEDLPAFTAYHADPRSSELYGPEEADPRHAAGLIKLFQEWAVEQPRLNYQFAITQRDGALIGCGGIRTKDATAGRGELGLELAPAYWGRFAYATELMRCLVDFGFRDLSLTEIFGSTVSANARVSRLVSAYGAYAVERPAPEWMTARGWRQIEWHINRTQWLALSSNDSYKPAPLPGAA